MRCARTFSVVVALAAAIVASESATAQAASASVPSRPSLAGAAHHRPSTKKKLVHAAGWAGAGAAASHVAGPVGSVAVGAAKYRHDLKRNWHTRTHAMAKIGAPIAAAAVAGPAGSAAYEGFEHRKWIKRHLVPHKHRHAQKRRR